MFSAGLVIWTTCVHVQICCKCDFFPSLLLNGKDVNHIASKRAQSTQRIHSPTLMFGN